MIILNKEQVKRLHKKLLYTTGGLDGIRDEEHLSSAGVGVRFWGHLGDGRLPDFNFLHPLE